MTACRLNFFNICADIFSKCLFALQGGDGFNHYKVRARLAIMEKRFKEAESIYLEQVSKKFCCILLENFDEAYSICVKLVFSLIVMNFMCNVYRIMWMKLWRCTKRCTCGMKP